MIIPAFEVIQETPVMRQIKLLISAELPFFDGHFAEALIMPAVAQLNLAQYFAESYFECQQGFSQLKNVKFRNIIHPNSIIMLNLKFNASRDTVEFEYCNTQNPSQLKSSGQIILAQTKG